MEKINLNFHAEYLQYMVERFFSCPLIMEYDLLGISEWRTNYLSLSEINERQRFLSVGRNQIQLPGRSENVGN